MDLLMKSPHQNLLDVEVNFAHTDSEEVYKQNLKKYGSEWYYAKNPITYNFNRLGYRMKQLEDIDYDNYYAFFGCSFGVGIGLDLKDTYAYKIAKKANVDYVNASIGGGSVDLVHYNLVNLLYRAPNKPKIIFINWPTIYRTFYWEEEKMIFMLPSLRQKYWEKSYEEFVMSDSHVFKRFENIRNTIKLICNLANIPVFEMTTHQDLEDTTFKHRHPSIITDITMSYENFENPRDLHHNRARDIGKTSAGVTSHPGFLHQDAIVERFFAMMTRFI